MDRLPPGEIPPGGKCEVKILARESGIDCTAFYGGRPYAHLREEFEARLAAAVGDGDPARPARRADQSAEGRSRHAQGTPDPPGHAITELAHLKAQAPPRIAAQLDEIIRLCQDIQRQLASADYRSQPLPHQQLRRQGANPAIAQPQARTPRQGRPCRRRRPLRPRSGLRAHHQRRMAAPRRLRPLHPPVAPGNQPGHRASRDRLAGRRHQPQHQATSTQRRRKTRAGPRCQPGPPPPGHPRGRRLPDSTTAASRSWSGPFSTPLASGKFP